MAASVADSGSQTATLTTEHSLYDNTTAGTFQFVVDTNAMASGDITELRIYSKTSSSGGTYRQAAVITVTGVDASPLFISPPFMCPNGAKFTLKQTTGTGRSFPWAVWSI